VSGLMLSNDSLARFADWLKPEDFFNRQHRLIYAATVELIEADQPADVVTVGQLLEERGQVEDIGGIGTLLDLTGASPSIANITAHAEIVRERSLMRQLIEAGTTLANTAAKPEGKTSRDIATEAANTLLSLSGGVRPRGPKTLREVGAQWYAELNARFDAEGEQPGIPSPWPHLDALTGGLQPGQLVILAARPSMGKSAVAINLALHALLADKRVMFFNLEMSASSIYSRLLACHRSIPLGWFREPKGDEEWGKVTAGVRDINGLPMVIDDTAGLSWPQIASRAKREHIRKPVDLVIVDHLHLIPLPGKTRETVEIGHITAGAKALAKSLGCPVLLLSQLNRNLESRANKRPSMADLRESGNIEQDADLILFLYRDDYYAHQDGRPSAHPGLIEMHLAKQRDGETGMVWGAFDGKHSRVDPTDYEPKAPEASEPKVRAIRTQHSGRDRAAGGSHG
jgi:replicative DNA helicase